MSGIGELLFNDFRVSVWDVTKFWIWVGGPDGFTAVKMYLMQLSYTLYMSKMTNFLVCVLPQFLKMGLWQ